LHLIAVGIDHHDAPVEVRERLNWPDPEVEGRVRADLVAGPLREAVLLCTCNRTDVYGVAEDPPQAVRAVLAVLAARAGWAPAALEPYARVFVGAEAVATHLMRVAAGLESLVLGETQVLGQVKDAYLRAAAQGTAGKLLHGLFHHALATAKRVHAETALASAPVSVGAAAVEFARRHLGGLEGRAVVVLGAGDTAATVARRLREAGCARLVVCNRTPARAEALAAQVGGEAAPVADLPALLREADVVIASTASPSPVLTPARIGAALAARGGRPLLLLDLAVPRDVDPVLGGWPGVHLADIDDLEAVAREGRAERAREAQAAEALVAEGVRAFARWVEALDVVPVIRALCRRFEEVAEQETERALGRLGELGPRQREAVRRLGRSIVQKLLSTPLERIKEAAGGPAGALLVGALVEAFDLDVPAVAALPRAAGVREPAG
jgi:glutamyl-tRNA reductase